MEDKMTQTLEEASKKNNKDIINDMLSKENNKPSAAIVEFGNLTPEEYSQAVAKLEAENQDSIRKTPHARLDIATGKVTYNPKTFKVMSMPDKVLFKLAKWEEEDKTHYISDYDTIEAIFKYGDIKVGRVGGYTIGKDKKVSVAQFKREDALSNFVIVGSLKEAKAIHEVIRATARKNNDDLDFNLDF